MWLILEGSWVVMSQVLSTLNRIISIVVTIIKYP